MFVFIRIIDFTNITNCKVNYEKSCLLKSEFNMTPGFDDHVDKYLSQNRKDKHTEHVLNYVKIDNASSNTKGVTKRNLPT